MEGEVEWGRFTKKGDLVRYGQVHGEGRLGEVRVSAPVVLMVALS